MESVQENEGKRLIMHPFTPPPPPEQYEKYVYIKKAVGGMLVGVEIIL